jgi:hypothetical protein
MEEIIPEQGEGEEDWDIVVGNAPLIEGQSIEGGYLWKMGEAHKEWRMRFFHIDLDIARGGRILYFTDASMRQKRGVIELANIESLVVPPAPSGNVSERSGIGYELLLREKPSPHRHHVREWRLKVCLLLVRLCLLFECCLSKGIHDQDSGLLGSATEHNHPPALRFSWCAIQRDREDSSKYGLARSREQATAHLYGGDSHRIHETARSKEGHKMRCFLFFCFSKQESSRVSSLRLRFLCTPTPRTCLTTTQTLLSFGNATKKCSLFFFLGCLTSVFLFKVGTVTSRL